ncbi:hypothetical protein [Allosphingosinicella sp.]|uniref:hypothetical protein n=1 Tax=Allosphingosinicella sp. TaxID=2823234 RepID=UPI003D72D2A4
MKDIALFALVAFYCIIALVSLPTIIWVWQTALRARPESQDRMVGKLAAVVATILMLVGAMSLTMLVTDGMCSIDPDIEQCEE